jgi:hypothetical protein
MFLFGWLADSSGRPGGYAIAALVLGAIGFAAAGLGTNADVRFLGLAAGLFGSLAVQPVFWALAMRRIDVFSTAAGFAVVYAISGVAGFQAPWLVGFLTDASGNPNAGAFAAAAALLIGLGLLITPTTDREQSIMDEWNQPVSATVAKTSVRPQQVTRLLCASALLRGSGFRRKVISFFENRSRAVMPEPGLDARLLLRTCLAADKREVKFHIGLACVALLALPISLLAPIFGLAIWILVSAGLFYFKTRDEQTLVTKLFSVNTFSLRAAEAHVADVEIPEHLATALPDRKQNLVVYAGFSPFVGAGIELGGWSFAISLDKAKHEGKPPGNFSGDDMYAWIGAELLATRLDNIVVADWYFASGTEIRADRDILPDLGGRPASAVSPALAGRYRNSNDPHLRHYMWARVDDWGGELVVSHFLHCMRIGGNLFVEMKKFVLLPIAGDYRAVDAIPPDRWDRRIATFIGALIAGPLMTIVAPFQVASSILRHLSDNVFDGRREHQRREQVIEEMFYNYGAMNNLRSMFSQATFQNYFQKSDTDFASKIIERRILDSIVEFLDKHGIDTSDIRERQTMILNSGILVQGGDVKAETLAVGTGASATKVHTSTSR